MKRWWIPGKPSVSNLTCARPDVDLKNSTKGYERPISDSTIITFSSAKVRLYLGWAHARGCELKLSNACCSTSCKTPKQYSTHPKHAKHCKRSFFIFAFWAPLCSKMLPQHTKKMSTSARALSPQGETAFQRLKADSISCSRVTQKTTELRGTFDQLCERKVGMVIKHFCGANPKAWEVNVQKCILDIHTYHAMPCHSIPFHYIPTYVQTHTQRHTYIHTIPYCTVPYHTIHVLYTNLWIYTSYTVHTIYIYIFIF